MAENPRLRGARYANLGERLAATLAPPPPPLAAMTPTAPTVQALANDLVNGRPPRMAPLQAAPVNTAPPMPGMVNGRPIRTAPLQAMGAMPPPSMPGPSAMPSMPSAMPGMINGRPIRTVPLQAAPVAGGVRGAVGRLGSQVSKTVGGRQVLPNLGGMKRVGLGLGIGVGSDFIADKVDPGGGLINNIISGAGTGAGFGIMSKNPYLAAGATVLGGVAGALGLLGGEEKAAFKPDKVMSAMSDMGVPVEQRALYMSLFDIEKDAVGEDVAKQNLLTRLQDSAVQMEQAQMAEQQGAMDQERMLASQAMAAQFFQPFAQQMITSAQQRAQAVEGMLPSLPPEYRGIAQAQAASALDNATRMATAYQAQAQMIPAMAAMESQTQNVNSIAAQLQQMGVQNAIQGQFGTGGGGVSLTDLLTPGQ